MKPQTRKEMLMTHSNDNHRRLYHYC